MLAEQPIVDHHIVDYPSASLKKRQRSVDEAQVKHVLLKRVRISEDKSEHES